ncbi:MAG: hypothetical protein WC539_00835 [Nitrospirota bacterium]
MHKKEQAEEFQALMQEGASVRKELALLTARVPTISEKSHIGPAEKNACKESPNYEVYDGLSAIYEVFEDIRTRAQKMLAVFSHEVAQHPIRSIAVAPGVGYMISRLFSGRNRS